MESIYSSGIEPDPHDALDVLAFVLCPMRVFSGGTSNREELEAIAALITPAKVEAIRRWYQVHCNRLRN